MPSLRGGHDEGGNKIALLELVIEQFDMVLRFGPRVVTMYGVHQFHWADVWVLDHCCEGSMVNRAHKLGIGAVRWLFYLRGLRPVASHG